MSEKKIGSSVQHLTLQCVLEFYEALDKEDGYKAGAFQLVIRELVKVHETHDLPMAQALLDWITLHG